MKYYLTLIFSRLELLSYLRANGFKTYIVSGSTIEFMRPWSQAIYGVPPEQVIGSSQAVRYQVRGGKPVLVRDPKLDFMDDGRDDAVLAQWPESQVQAVAGACRRWIAEHHVPV